MNPTLSYLLGRRMWWVSGVNIWGTIANFEAQFIITETEGASKRIVFSSVPIGGEVQQIEYGGLVDIKGNRLPGMLTNPRVVPMARGNSGVVVQGTEGAKSFVLAKTGAGNAVAPVDLLIIEMG